MRSPSSLFFHLIFSRAPDETTTTRPQMHKRLQPFNSASPSRTSPPRAVPRLASLADIQASARQRSLVITLTTLGPFYRVVCRRLDQETSAANETGRIPGHMAPMTPAPTPQSAPGTLASLITTPATSVAIQDSAGMGKPGPDLPPAPGMGRGKDPRSVLGVSEGFVIPWLLGGLMHCDTLQIFTRGIKGEEGEKVRGGVLGLGLMLGGAVLAHGFEQDTWHERLVRYYSYFGFKKVRKVGGNGLYDLPHLLVWGGEGERMDADIEKVLERWTPAILSSNHRQV